MGKYKLKLKYNNNKCKVSGPIWSETFDLPNGSYTIPDIQDYYLKMIQKHEPTIETNENSPIYPNGAKNRISFKIKTGYKLELLTSETQKLLGDGPIIDKDKAVKMYTTRSSRYVLLHCDIVQNDYLQNSKLLYEFAPDKTFGQLIFVKPPVFIQCKTIDSIFDYIEIWFTDQDNNSLQIEDKASVALIIQNSRL